MTSAFPHVCLCSRGFLTWNTPCLFPNLSCLPQAPILGLVHLSALSSLISKHAWCLHSKFSSCNASETFPPQPSVLIFPLCRVGWWGAGGVLYLANTAPCEWASLGVPWQTPHTAWLQAVDTHPSRFCPPASEIQVSAGRIPLRLWEMSVPGLLLPASLGLPAAGILGLWTQGPGLCLHLHEVSSLPGSLCPRLFFKDTSHWIPSPSMKWTSSLWLHPQRYCFKKGHILTFWFWVSINFGGMSHFLIAAPTPVFLSPVACGEVCIASPHGTRFSDRCSRVLGAHCCDFAGTLTLSIIRGVCD